MYCECLFASAANIGVTRGYWWRFLAARQYGNAQLSYRGGPAKGTTGYNQANASEEGAHVECSDRGGYLSRQRRRCEFHRVLQKRV